MVNQIQEKFQSLLRELFQFDCADLDFGIYRIMNHKRQVIDKWITEDLPSLINEELSRGMLAEQAQAQEALQSARQKLLDALGEDAIDANGNLNEKYRNIKAGREYLEAQAKAKGTRSNESLQATIYNHLYTFFSRYWQDGDFISKRRYSKKERYAIPYNGEEVMLYWANHDQYYIKTGEYFTDYSYKDMYGVTVYFKLKQADVEQNNVKGQKRFFVPVMDGISWDKVARTLTIPFEFRPLTEQENIAYGQKNQQESIINKAVVEIPKRVKDAEALSALTAERRRKDDGTSVSMLEHHLRQYTRRNTSDFFIHKDLRGFLSRELDFYLKNEVLNLEEMEVAGEHLAEGWFQLMRLIKRMGGHIIDFLAQIEDFQKMLWEKKKFITETFYVITMGNIPESFYPEIAANDAQWEEWKEILHINEGEENIFTAGKKRNEKRVEFLKNHPTLPLDTRHFNQDFTDRLMASYDELDEMTDGLLVHSENWQALNLLLEKYRERVKCIYIDPPYNTGYDWFIYRDSYRHSCWATMMNDRLCAGATMLSPEGIFLVSIGEDEFDHLTALLSNIFSQRPIPFVWKSRAKPTNAGNAIYQPQIVAEFVLANNSKNAIFYPLPSGEERQYPNQDEYGRYRTTTILTSNRGRYRRDTMRFEIAGYVPPPDKRWKAGEEEINELYKSHRIGFGNDGEPFKKIYQQDESDLHIPLWTYLSEELTGTAESGKADLSALLGKEHGLDSVKPKELIKVFLSACAREGIIVDFFAGSGTTAHAVIEANQEDGYSCKFLLVEQEKYFDSIILPRIKKVTFTPEWKDGKPKRMATAEEAERSPRIVKVIRLESYEDALNNLTFDEESGNKAQELFKDDYLLHYMLKWETRKSETLLDVEKLQMPFSYKLRLHRDGETRERLVDLPETFNYLLGLDVQTRKAYNDNGHRYLVYRGVLRNGRTVAIIWRNTKGWSKEDYERDRKFVIAQKMINGADEVFVNGDSIIPGAQSLDPIFKERMFAGMEV